MKNYTSHNIECLNSLGFLIIQSIHPIEIGTIMPPGLGIDIPSKIIGVPTEEEKLEFVQRSFKHGYKESDYSKNVYLYKVVLD